MCAEKQSCSKQQGPNSSILSFLYNWEKSLHVYSSFFPIPQLAFDLPLKSLQVQQTHPLQSHQGIHKSKPMKKKHYLFMSKALCSQNEMLLVQIALKSISLFSLSKFFHVKNELVKTTSRPKYASFSVNTNFL